MILSQRGTGGRNKTAGEMEDRKGDRRNRAIRSDSDSGLAPVTTLSVVPVEMNLC